MNAKAVFLALFLVTVAGGLLVKFGGTASSTGGRTNANTGPVPPKTGPFAKAIVDVSPVHDFGLMEQSQKGEHVFTIRNEGQATLEMAMGDHSCQCTLGSLGKTGLAPGESTEVKLEWEIKAEVTVFQHYAKVKTNDPANPEISFRVRGLVGKRQVIKPSTTVSVGLLSEGKTTERVLTLHSEIVSEFTIEKIEPSSPLITVETRPLTADELVAVTIDPEAERMRVEMTRKMEESKKTNPTATPQVEKHEHSHGEASVADEDFAKKIPAAKSGYELKIAVQPLFPIGRFRETIVLTTSIKDAAPMTISVDGNRSGPIEFLSTPGAFWSPSEGLLRITRFPAKDGKKIRLLMFVRKHDADFEITDAQITPSVLHHQLIKDKNFKGTGSERFDLILEFPAGGKPVTVAEPNLGTIVLHTNHPGAQQVKLNFEMVTE